jgi:hypothetical protein
VLDMADGERFAIFACVWVSLGVALGVLFWRGSAERKRMWFPRLTVLAGALFIAFTYWISPVAEALYVVVPVTALITYLNLKTTKFCPKCGAYYQTFGALYRANYCRRCGFELPRATPPR